MTVLLALIFLSLNHAITGFSLHVYLGSSQIANIQLI